MTGRQTDKQTDKQTFVISRLKKGLLNRIVIFMEFFVLIKCFLQKKQKRNQSHKSGDKGQVKLEVCCRQDRSNKSRYLIIYLIYTSVYPIFCRTVVSLVPISGHHVQTIQSVGLVSVTQTSPNISVRVSSSSGITVLAGSQMVGLDVSRL